MNDNLSQYFKEREEEELAAWRVLSKDDWIAAARSKFTPGEPERCEVCRKLGVIAQAHHTIPLSDQFDRKFKRPSQRFVWLCPNHHVMVHLFMRQRDFRVQGDATIQALYELSQEEIVRIDELIAAARKGFEGNS